MRASFFIFRGLISVCSAVFFGVGVSALAAVPPTKAAFQKQNKYIESGAIVGGQAQRDLLIREVRHSYSKKEKLERLVFEVTPALNIVGNRVGFFHASIDPINKKVIVDLAGVAGAQKPLDDIAASLKTSPIVKEASLTMDPEDRSATLVLALREGLGTFQIEAFELKNDKQPGRVVIDIRVR